MTGANTTPREPRVFKIDELDQANDKDGGLFGEAESLPPSRRTEEDTRTISAQDLQRGVRWGSLMLSAMFALASLAAGLWFTRFVTVALERQDWAGWLATALMGFIALCLGVLLVRELWGIGRLARLSRLRKAVAEAVATPDSKRERTAVLLLARHYRGRADMKWGLARLKDHAGDVRETGELLRLADRELLQPLDQEARRTILKSSKRVATVTALSPMMWIAVLYVLVENVRMFRALAGLYGGRPGVFGALRLGRLVVTHIIATGGLAMTDDLLGQFLGQDALRRLSRRLGEGAFNGALTARLGVAAISVIRPLPFLDSDEVRVREIFKELYRSLRGGGDQPPAGAARAP